MAGDSELRRFVDDVVIPAESELHAGGGLELRKLAQDAGCGHGRCRLNWAVVVSR